MKVEINFLSGGVHYFDNVRNFHFYENSRETRVLIVDDQIFVHFSFF